MDVDHTLATASLDTLSSSPQQFLKMEDIHTEASPSPSFDNGEQQSMADFSMSTPPANIVIQSKPAKKRKSWGQTLPEPTTALPPRKRAKTDDEKEQRRIERIKRNRAAAHNSRERKRQETEKYAVALARAEAELAAYRQLHGPLPASVVLPEVTLTNEFTEYDDDKGPSPQIRRKTSQTPGPTPLSLVESHGTPEDAPSPSSPLDTTFDGSLDIKQEPTNSTAFPSNLPPAFVNPEAKPLDMTQHSAEMLCDLQCQSSSRASTTSTSANWWAALFLTLMTQQLQTTYKTMLLALWTLSPSRMARQMQASCNRLASRSRTSSMTTPQLFRQMALAQRNAAAGRQQPGQGASDALRVQMAGVARMRGRVSRKGLFEASRQRRAFDRGNEHDDEGRRDDKMGGV